MRHCTCQTTNLSKDSVSIDVVDGNNQGVISAGDNVSVTDTATLLQTETTGSLVGKDTNDESSSLNVNAIISAAWISFIIMLVIIYFFIIHPRLKRRKKTNPDNNQLTNHHSDRRNALQPSEYIIRNL